MNRSIIGALVLIALAAVTNVRCNREQPPEDRMPPEASSPLVPLAVDAPTVTAEAGTPAAPASKPPRMKSQGWDRAAIVTFPDGSEVPVTLRRVRVSPAPFPWPERVIDQYEALRRLAEAGNAAAAIALHRYISVCQSAHEDEASLKRAIERLHREGVLERPDGSLAPNTAVPGGDLTQFEYSNLRGPFEFCRGITAEQKAQLLTWTRRAAEAGDASGLTAWARSLGETKAGLAAWEKAWRHGVRGALAPLAELYERGVPGVADGQPDYIRAYAYKLIGLKVHEARYGEHPSTTQRNELASMEKSLRHTGGFLTPQEETQAIKLAKEMLAQNQNCCTGIW